MATTNQQPEREPQEVERYDKTKKTTEKQFNEVPRLFLNAAEEQDFAQLEELKQRSELHQKVTAGETLTLMEQRRWVRFQANLTRYGPLSEQERDRMRELSLAIGQKTEQFTKASKLELQLSPDAKSFENFESINDELNELEDGPRAEPKVRKYSDVALEEVRILLNRLFGKNHALRTFFEKYVVLKYDAARPVARREAGDTSPGGGAEIKKGRDRDGKDKYIVTVDSDTFLKVMTWTALDGTVYEYLKPDYLNAAFTIGRAILQSAMNDESLKEFKEQLNTSSKQKRAPFPEKLLEGGAEHTIDLRHGKNREEQALDFLALYLVDPAQAAKIDKNAAANAATLIGDITPGTARQLADGKPITVAQSQMNLEYLYHDYDPARRPKSELGKTGEYFGSSSARDLGFWGRIGAGAVGGFALSMLAGTGPSGWLVAGTTYLSATLRAPLKYIRTIQNVYAEQADFYYELASAEADKKQLALIGDREEGSGDRLKRMKDAIDSGSEESMRWILLSLSKSGTFNIWYVYLYLLQTDKLFKKTGGQEITQQGYNFVQRLHRFSNQAKRVGTVIGIYGQEIDKYGRKRFMLKDYDKFQSAVDVQWASRGDQEAQNAALETFEMMKDSNGYLELDDEYGKDMHDPNSRGWQVADTGDLRASLGSENATQLFDFMQHHWKGDKKYKRKFGAYERGVIGRMQKIKPDKFPTQYTKQTAKEAFNHYNTKLPKPMEAEDPRVKKAMDQIDKKSFKEILDDDELDSDSISKLAQQVDKPEFDSPLGGEASRPTEPITTGLGRLNNELTRLERDAKRSNFSEAVRGELLVMTGVIRDDANGKWQNDDLSVEDALKRTTERIERILADSYTPESEAFKVRTWITELSGFQPKAQALQTFRKELNESLKPYEAELDVQLPALKKLVTATGSGLSNLAKKASELEAAPKAQTIDQLKTTAAQIAQQLELNRDISPETVDLINLLNGLSLVNSRAQFAESVEQIGRDATRWSKTVPTVETDLTAVRALATNIQQVLRVERVPVNFPPAELAEKHAQRVAMFKRLRGIDPALQQRDDLTEHEMFQALKLATVALERAKGKDSKDKGTKDKSSKKKTPDTNYDDEDPYEE